jgi:hypothetical protein
VTEVGLVQREAETGNGREQAGEGRVGVRVDQVRRQEWVPHSDVRGNADRRARVEAGAVHGHRRLGGGDDDEQGAFVGHGSERTGSSATAATGFSVVVTAALARALAPRTSSRDARPAVTAMAAITTVACWNAASAAAPPDG